MGTPSEDYINRILRKQITYDIKAITLSDKRKISISGGVTAEGKEFDGSEDIDLEVTTVDPEKIKGAFNVEYDAESDTINFL